MNRRQLFAGLAAAAIAGPTLAATSARVVSMTLHLDTGPPSPKSAPRAGDVWIASGPMTVQIHDGLTWRTVGEVTELRVGRRA